MIAPSSLLPLCIGVGASPYIQCCRNKPRACTEGACNAKSHEPLVVPRRAVLRQGCCITRAGSETRAGVTTGECCRLSHRIVRCIPTARGRGSSVRSSRISQQTFFEAQHIEANTAAMGRARSSSVTSGLSGAMSRILQPIAQVWKARFSSSRFHQGHAFTHPMRTDPPNRYYADPTALYRAAFKADDTS